jgi:hypothetical protein
MVASILWKIGLQHGQQDRALDREPMVAAKRSLVRSSVTARQPVSAHSRSNTKAGPIRRTAAVASSCAALSTIAWVTNRAPRAHQPLQLTRLPRARPQAPEGS